MSLYQGIGRPHGFGISAYINKGNYSFLVSENTEKALPHLTRLLAGIDSPPDAGLLVVLTNRGGLVVVRNQALLEGIGIVVGALNKRLASDIVLHGVLGRVEDLVV